MIFPSYGGAIILEIVPSYNDTILGWVTAFYDATIYDAPYEQFALFDPESPCGDNASQDTGLC